MKAFATFALLLVLILVSVSAYLRLDHSGLGCANWPSCYGYIGAPSGAAADAGATVDRLLDEAQRPESWATPVHRLVATMLGVLILGMALWSLQRRRDRLLTLALLGLTIFLAWLGIYSAGLHSPAVVMGNMAGGFGLLGLLGWLVFRDARPMANSGPVVRAWVIVALVVLSLQISLGGLTSANFAATACATLPDCNGSWLPGGDVFDAFNLNRVHEVSDAGFVMGGAERTDIHKLHRLVAMLALFSSVAAGVLALRARLGTTAIVVIAVVVTEFVVGAAAILTDLPIGIAVAHNWLAAILLLSLLRLLALCSNRQTLLIR